MSTYANGDSTRVEKVVENSWLKLAVRIGSPILIGLGIYLMQGFEKSVSNVSQSVNELERAQWQILGETENLRGVVNEKLKHMDTKIQNNGENIHRHENSINQLWRNKADKEYR